MILYLFNIYLTIKFIKNSMHLIFLNRKSIITYLETVDGLDYFKLVYKFLLEKE